MSVTEEIPLIPDEIFPEEVLLVIEELLPDMKTYISPVTEEVLLVNKEVLSDIEEVSLISEVQTVNEDVQETNTMAVETQSVGENVVPSVNAKVVVEATVTCPVADERRNEDPRAVKVEKPETPDGGKKKKKLKQVTKRRKVIKT